MRYKENFSLIYNLQISFNISDFIDSLVILFRKTIKKNLKSCCKEYDHQPL